MSESMMEATDNGTIPSPFEENLEQADNPMADIVETPDAYLLFVDLPGATKDGIAVKLEQAELTIQAAAPHYHDGNSKVIHRELESHGYARTFSLGEGIDRANVDAHFDRGVLAVKLFKSEQAKPRTITIN